MELRPWNAGQKFNGASQEVEQLFKTHFKGLHAYACIILRDSHLAEEIVQEVFVKLCERASRINIETSLESYLYRSVYNESLNHQKHEKVKARYQTMMSRKQQIAAQEPASSDYQALETRLRLALSELPQQCRTVFLMSRFEELKYREIADRMGISVKTVENQMGKALRIMRQKLKGFLLLAIFLLTNFLKP
jgi:RNA polymerase sigma-70 factor (ECF subfamily)